MYRICNWMLNDKLKLNYDKTEFLIIGTSQQLAKVSITSLRVGTATITPVLLQGTWARGLILNRRWQSTFQKHVTLPSIIWII